jgi:hypothetical protein
VLTCIFTTIFALMYLNYAPFREVSLINYNQINYVLWGMIWGLAYVLAELPSSYIKRRLDISPGSNVSGLKGATFIFVDQEDSVFCCLIVLWIFSALSLSDIIYLFFMATALHLLLNYLLYLVGLKNQPA